MNLREQIRKMSDLPARLNTMLEHVLSYIKDVEEKEELCKVACVVSSAAWRFWQAWRLAEDNRSEHEWVVFANIMRIAEKEKLSLSEKRIATAFAFTHDTFPIRRIMEADIEDLLKKASKVEKTDPKRAEELRRQAEALKVEKGKQRKEHMKRGAENAEFLLSRLKRPDSPDDSLFTKDEIKICKRIVGKHDSMKTGEAYPPGNDRLAVVCVEGDTLWPLHPIGVLADVERPGKKGRTENFSSSVVWRKKVEESLHSLLKYRQNWEKKPEEKFQDGESIFRTEEGYRIYSEWRRFWNL